MYIECAYFDGLQSRGQSATAMLLPEGFLEIDVSGTRSSYELKQLRILERVGNIPITINLPEGKSILIKHGPNADALAKAIESPKSKLIGKFESKPRYALASFLLMLIIVTGLYLYALPGLSNVVATHMPMSTQVELRDQILQVLNYTLVKPTTLSEEEQSEANAAAVEIIDPSTAKIIYGRFAQDIKNAVAIPPDRIIVSDSLVRKLSSVELQSVLAHEAGHLHKQHGMKMLARSSIVSTFFLLASGGANLGLDAVSGIASSLLDAKFSRAQETEADEYAVDLFKAHSLSPDTLAAALEKIAPPDTDNDTDFFASHPLTSERLVHIRALAAAQ